MLVDRDTVLLAPPARDLWWLGPRDVAAYAERTGRVVADGDLAWRSLSAALQGLG